MRREVLACVVDEAAVEERDGQIDDLRLAAFQLAVHVLAVHVWTSSFLVFWLLWRYILLLHSVL